MHRTLHKQGKGLFSHMQAKLLADWLVKSQPIKQQCGAKICGLIGYRSQSAQDDMQLYRQFVTKYVSIMNVQWKDKSRGQYGSKSDYIHVNIINSNIIPTNTYWTLLSGCAFSTRHGIHTRLSCPPRDLVRLWSLIRPPWSVGPIYIADVPSFGPCGSCL